MIELAKVPPSLDEWSLKCQKGRNEGWETCMRRNTPNDDRKDTISIAFRVNTGIPSEYLINLDSRREPESSLKLASPTRPKKFPHLTVMT